MAILMGPVLSFRGYDPDAQQWNLSALVVANTSPGPLKIGQGSEGVSAAILWKDGSKSAYRYNFSFPVKDGPSIASYTIAGTSYKVAVPGAGQSPTMAYASCNGFSALKLMKSVKVPNALWNEMAAQHAKNPYHLLLLGGDQVYADSMWETDGPMKDWAAKSWDDGNAAAAPPSMRRWLDSFYFRLYTERWAQPEVAAMLASVPNIAMWDDHDLTDGWGSYPKERQTCKVYQAIWASASKAFAVFQQQLDDEETRPGAIGGRPSKTYPVKNGAFSCGYAVGNVAILAVDMRTQRDADTQVIGKTHWNEIYDWIDKLPGNVNHLLLMSSIPVIYPAFDLVEKLLGLFPGHQDLEDDLRDHWNSDPHRGEQLRLIKRLLDLPKRTRPLIVSGDVHVAALGVAESSRPQSTQTAVNQLISSGIVHPGPGATVLWALHNLFDTKSEIERGVVTRMVAFPNQNTKFIGSRNYLSLEPDQPDPNRLVPRIWANWWIEGARFPITKVIEPNS